MVGVASCRPYTLNIGGFVKDYLCTCIDTRKPSYRLEHVTVGAESLKHAVSRFADTYSDLTLVMVAECSYYSEPDIEEDKEESVFDDDSWVDDPDMGSRD